MESRPVCLARSNAASQIAVISPGSLSASSVEPLYTLGVAETGKQWNASYGSQRATAHTLRNAFQ